MVDSAPTVTDTTPARDATNVPVGDPLTVTFSEAVTATETWATLICGGSVAVTLSSGAAITHTITPNAALPYDTDCTATIDYTKIADTDGTPTPMDPPNYSWNFHTSGSDALPTVSSTVPDTAATGVAANADLVINFSEAVTITPSFFDLSCSISGSHGGPVSGGAASYTFNPDVDFLPGEVCTATVQNDQVTDQDGTPDNMAADFVWTFTVAAATNVCGTAYIPIHTIQGSGLVSPINGQSVVTEGIVTAVFQTAPKDLNGIFIQAVPGTEDADALTSEGVFVFHNTLSSTVGNIVRIQGTVGFYQNQTQLTSPSILSTCSSGNSLPAPVALDLPDASFSFEPYEGMLVSISEPLTVQQNYYQGRYGQVTLGAGGRIPQIHNVTKYTGTDPYYQFSRMIILDDASSGQNPNPISYYANDGYLRAGDTITGITGILDQGPVNSYVNEALPYNWYRIQPTVAVTTANITQVNPRPAAPPAVGGRIKVASANVLNYFTTLDMAPYRSTAPYDGGDNTPRGADSAAEFDRQQAKIVAELAGLNADVVGLMEIESWDGAASGIGAPQALVNALNTYIGTPGLYAVVADPALGFFDPTEGGDYIQVALIYKTSTVTPVGASLSTNAAIFDRSPFAQEFQEIATGEQFAVVVNHFKSKGCSGATGLDADQGDGQGCWNQKRRDQAAALLTFINTDLVPLDPDVLVIGDLNSYGAEDPITDLVAGGLVNQVATFVPEADRYSYVFDGTAGYLDHGLGTLSTTPQISDVAFWHVNADEPSVIDYNTEFKTVDLYQAHQYKASDHDPVLIGLNLSPLTTIWVDDDWAAEPNGTLVSVGGGTHIIGYDAFVTIQAGIAAAPAGGTVNVLDGTYNESITLNKVDITVQSVDGAATTIINAGGAVQGVGIDDYMGTVTFDGFTVMNFTDLGIAQSMWKPNSVFHVLNNVIIPAGDFLRNGIQVSGSGSTVIGNSVQGASYYSVDYGSSAILAVNGSNILIENNTITGTPDYGIAIQNWNNTTPVSNIRVLSNSVTGADDAVILSSQPGFSIDGVKIEFNQLTNFTNGLSSEGTVLNVDESPNWWGAITGPNPIPALGVYTPWCGDAGCTFLLPTASGDYEIPAGTPGADVQAILNNATQGSKITFLGSTGPLSGGYIINTPHLTIILADGTVIQNASPCFVINADYTTITTDSIGGAQCVPTSGSNGIDVTGTRLNIVITGIEFVGATGNDGIHFAGGITDTLILDNFIHNFTGAGLFFSAQPAGDVKIQGNLFKDNTGNGIEAGAFTVQAEYNSWGHIDGAAAGDGASANVDAEPWTHVDLYMTSSGSPWASQVVSGQTITYTVYGNLHEAFAADVTLVYPANLTLIPASLTNLGTFDSLASFDTSVAGTIQFYGVGTGNTAQSGTAMPIFSAQFTAGTPGAALPMNLDETSDGFAMNIGDEGYSSNIYANALLNGEVTIIGLPTLASTDLPGYYLTGDPQEFHVLLTNPADGGTFSNVLVNFRITGALTTDLALEYYETTTSTWETLPLTQDGADLVGSYGPAGGFPIIPGYTANSAFRVTAATAKSYPVTITLNDLGSTPVNAELARLEQTAVVYAKPVITSADLVGPYLVGIAQDFTLNITDPSGIPEPFELVFTFPSGTTIVYDGVTYTCAATCPPIPVTLAAASNDLTFSVTFPDAFSGDVTVTLLDSDWTPTHRPLATFTQTGVVAYAAFNITGTFSMQGRSTRAGIPVTLTSTPYTYNGTSIEAITANLSFSNVAGTTYLITTNQPRYLDVIASLNITKVIDALNTTISDLMLRGGDADDNNQVFLGDASVIGTQYGYIGITNNGDVNFSGKVDIYDLALVGGNYTLTSGQAYAGVDGLFPAWVP